MSDNHSVVLVEELRQVFNEALDSLREWTGDTVGLGEDFFWSIQPEATYDLYTPPEADQLALGRLSVSWDNLVRVRASGGGVPACALVWIAEILRVLGYRASWWCSGCMALEGRCPLHGTRR
ncbi:putative membrane protein [Saccharopolyspora lacisalsi]|uniref:Putative membrane protein n=1 Tax=Halosaccharopolyspora lacisalsi TaxID=1000566 RepID=A0A839DS47_9PSEU|nr:hypothetical protein [Halosaccharopolyspora lacisalsi]MBA8823780.1 putative membrane protein [Halosaccharopolyspora lacisalsi]